jgi:hypothetical protein
MPKLPEPAASQEAFGFSAPKPSPTPGREAERKDLKRVAGPEAAQFAKENPDADIYDFQRHMKAKADPTFDKVP